MRTRTRWHVRLVARAALLATPVVVAVSVAGAAPAAAVVGGVVTVTPASQNALAGTTASVVANETLGGAAIVDAITFLVTSGPNAGRSGFSATPNAPFSYVGNGFLGTDTVRACGTGFPAPCGFATVTWTANNFSNLSAFGVPAIDFHPNNSRTEVNNFGNNNTTLISDVSDSQVFNDSPSNDGWDRWDSGWDGGWGD
jgi:hypothetical protein